MKVPRIVAGKPLPLYSKPFYLELTHEADRRKLPRAATIVCYGQNGYDFFFPKGTLQDWKDELRIAVDGEAYAVEKCHVRRVLNENKGVIWP